MRDDQILNSLADQYGIVSSFRDLSGVERPTSRDTKLALLQANGIDTTSAVALAEELQKQQHRGTGQICEAEYIIKAGKPFTIQISQPVEWNISLDEDQAGQHAPAGRATSQIRVPALPAGIHTLSVVTKGENQSVTIIAAPNKAPSVREQTGLPSIWGINTALYGLHSQTTQGLGTYKDLALTSEAMAAHGASFLGINPVHSIGWAEDEIISPYSPSHRSFLNIDHIDLVGLSDPSTRSGSRSSQIDYHAHRSAQKVELENAFSSFQNNASNRDKQSFHAFQKVEGGSLSKFALFEALSEVHGPDWQIWPEQYQNADSELVAEFASANQSRIEFHVWCQWLASKQLSNAQSRALSAGMPLGLYLDLAVGARRGGAETWCERSVIAQGVSIGAPPDHLSPAGQKWNLAAFAPARQIQTQYRSFRSILAHSLRYAGILRIDHVLGLNRSFWIPDDGVPGGYIRQPFEALLAVVAIEAQKAGAIIVGEDLGLVPDGLRKRLHERGLYSYSVLQYEKDEDGKFRKPDDLQKDSLTCFSTHDTPTLHGYMQQRDIDWWRKLDWIDDASEARLRVSRENEVGALRKINGDENATSELTPFKQLSFAVHGALAKSPVTMISVQLDDALGEIEAQNLPGTVDEHLNWQRRMSVPVEALSTNVDIIGIAEQMRDARRSALIKEAT